MRIATMLAPLKEWVLSVRSICVVLVGLAPLSGCGRSTSEEGGEGDSGISGAGTAGTGGAGTSGTGGQGGGPGRGGGAGEGDGDAGDPGACVTPGLPDAPLLRLTVEEIENSLGALFGAEWNLPPPLLPSDVTYFPGLSPVSALFVEVMHRFAHDFALEVTADAESLRTLVGCDVEVDGEDVCRQRFFDERIARVLRRPLDADDTSDFEAVFARGAELGGGFQGGIRAVVEVALQSPEFLYRVEFGEPLDVPTDDPRSGWGRPAPFEMASRLSYLFWRTAPDDDLVDAAARGGLRDSQEIRMQAERLLRDDRAKRPVQNFYFERLSIDPRLIEQNGSSDLTPAVAALLVRETRAFIDDVTFQGTGDFTALLSAPVTFLNEELASYYGIEGVTGETFERVERDPTSYAGILTQASFLASHAVRERSHPFRRGLAIYQGLLCQEMDPPPGGQLPPPIPPPDPDATTRELFEQVTSHPECAVCHAEPQQIGYAFEHFDGTGRYRETENGRPIDATGRLSTTDAAGSFDGPAELARRIAESDDAKRCFAGKWLAYAYGRPEGPSDACSREALESAFASGNVRELLVALSQTDVFLHRPVIPAAQ